MALSCIPAILNADANVIHYGIVYAAQLTCSRQIKQTNSDGVLQGAAPSKAHWAFC